ncbi:MAG TPA: protein-disulfide reductase DsbD domain-containing protein [Puia sp.]|nr:protein-disulfide reductase DsbD domain-containing protein [Puia sp.]
MKQSIVVSILFLSLVMARAQSNNLHPIAWHYSARKIADKTYEVHLTAQLEDGWHAYSQRQPKEAVAQPTEIRFKSNPLISMTGKTREVGAMEKWKDEASGIMANQYAKQVDFIQVVKLKAKVRTNVTGSLTYQVCTNEMCLPPRTEAFSIELGE